MRLRSAFLVFGFFLAIAAGIASCGSSTSPSGGGGAATGPNFDFGFPATSVSHAFTFADTGSWAYQCSPHGNCCGMTGTVVVTSTASAESALVSVGNSDQLSFSPQSVSIKPGGVVRWVNVSTFGNHTVTR